MVDEAIRRLPASGPWTITGPLEWKLEVAKEIASRPELDGVELLGLEGDEFTLRRGLRRRMK